jgi:hypothetical protein
MPVRGKPRKQVFHPSHRPWKIASRFHIRTGPTVPLLKERKNNRHPTGKVLDRRSGRDNPDETPFEIAD